MPSYNRLTGGKGIELHALKKAGLRQRDISAQPDAHPSTISRDVKRNTGLRGYRPKQTHRSRISAATRQSVGGRIGKDRGFLAHPCRARERGDEREHRRGDPPVPCERGKRRPLTDQEIRDIMDRLNTGPGKCLAFSRPNQVVSEVRSDVAPAG